jgi:plastocyanin
MSFSALRTALALACAAALGASAVQAQTTHVVMNGGANNEFSPANLQIQVGDTVLWDWAGGFHDVESGDPSGTPDGIFDSGAPTTNQSTTFSVTFDQAFLDANPVPGNDYAYYCSVHSTVGQTGNVHVAIPASATPYGCGVNPSSSLQSLGSGPQLGQPWSLAVHNPLGTQAPGSLAFVAVSFAPAAGFPCGLPLPSFGMGGPAATGEMLLALGATQLILPLYGPKLWLGAPVAVNVPIPNLPFIVGLDLYAQGALFDPSGPVDIALTGALAASIGG